MIDATWRKQKLKLFGGQWDLLDSSDIPLDRGAIEATNCEFVDGRVQTRRGLFAASQHIPGVYNEFNWVSPTGSWILGFSNESKTITFLSVTHLGMEGDSTAYSNASAVLFAPGGSRVLAAIIDITSGEAEYQGRIFSYKTAFTAATAFTGSGLNDATIAGTYTGGAAAIYRVAISLAGGTDQFDWYKNTILQASGVAITGAAQALDDGITVTFGATTGHTLGDVWSRSVTTLTSDKLFAPPITYGSAVAPTEPGSGNVTAGLHRLGYIIETRNGFIGRPSPDSGSGTPGIDVTFTPYEFTATGGKNLQWALTTTWPADAVKVHLIMSPVSNPSQYYFVPGSVDTVAGGTSDTATLVANISDEELRAQPEATQHLLLYTQTTGGSGPFSPYFIAPYGDRMVYLARLTDSSGRSFSSAFASNRGNFQHVTLDNHQFSSPGQVDMVCAAPLKNNIYIFGRNGTFVTQDTGGDPVTWPALQLVDGKRGTVSVKGVDISPSGDFMWVADISGLYMFNGAAYTDLPISYYQQETWDRINWVEANHKVQVVDYKDKNRVVVLAPLDSATDPTHLLVWDYTRGKSPDKVRFSLWSVTDFNPGCLCVVNNYNGIDDGDVFPKGRYLRIGCRSNLQGLNDEPTTSYTATPYRDAVNTTGLTVANRAILSDYETALFASSDNVMQHHGAHFSVSGAGTLDITMKGVDGTVTDTLGAVTLAANPGQNYLRNGHLLSEGASYLVSTDAVDEYFILTEITHYYSEYALQR